MFITRGLSQWRDHVRKNSAENARARRNLQQVLANGLLLSLLAFIGSMQGQDGAILAAFLGCTGAVAGDTWATEASHISRQLPRLLTSGKPVAVGTPGAVSPLGTLLTATAGFVAAAVYTLVAFIEPSADSPSINLALLFVAATLGGLLGALVDLALILIWRCRHT